MEIGCSTGQATLALARRGYSVTGVELGDGLAQVARVKLAGYPDACWPRAGSLAIVSVAHVLAPGR